MKAFFGSSVPVLIMSVASQSSAFSILIPVEETGKNRLESGQESVSSSGVT